jgi:hypothetical protein
LEHLTTKQIWTLLQEHNQKHGNVFRVKSFEEYFNNENFIDAETNKWVRAIVIRDYERRSDVWEDFKIETKRMLKEELVQFEIALLEHPQGYLISKNNKKRKRPSLWSADHLQNPDTVEMAAANFFKNLGYNVSHSFCISMILLSAYSHISYGEEEGYRTVLFSENPEKISQANNVQLSELEEVLETHIGKAINDYIERETRFINDKLLDQTRLENLSKMDCFEREKFLEREFCNYNVLGSKNRHDLKEKIILAHNQIPKKFLSRYFGNQAAYKQLSGIPDLFLWNEKEFKFVEVKSPNDHLNFNQAKFYKYQIKNLGLEYNLARVVPKKLEN